MRRGDLAKFDVQDRLLVIINRERGRVRDLRSAEIGRGLGLFA